MIKQLVVLSMILLLTSCSGGKGEAQSSAAAPQGSSQTASAKAPVNLFKSISPAEAQSMIQSRKDLLILDVRNPPELKEGKIAGSVLAPFWSVVKGQYQVPAGRPILVVCAVGGRSYAIGQFLNKNGYPEVYSLSGGISQWKSEGRPVVY